MATTDSTPGTPTATPSSLPAHRYVPGAPPPVPPSKSQKKKRQSKLKTLAASAHESALTDHAPDSEDIKTGKVDSALLAGAGSGADTDAEDTKSASAATPTEHEKEKSLVVDAISKRIKALGKKVQRLNEYKAQENINEDQKAAISGLAALEGSVKELESIKKTVEGLEISQAKIRSQERSELKRDYEHRVTEAAQHAEAALLPRITSLLSFLALRNLLTHSTPSDISISEPERNAIISAGDILLAHPPLGHVEEVVKGFLAGAGSWEDVEYSRLLEITSQFAAPRPPTPIPDPSIPLDPTTAPSVPDEPEPEAEPEVEEVHPPAEPETEPEMIANDLGIPATTTGGGFHFMQESELEAPPEMTESQEWVAVQPGVNSEDVAVGTEESQADFEAPPEEAGAEVAEGVTGGGAPLDWATAGDDELPDLGGLQATFGGSGSQTPVAQSYSAAQTSAPSGPPAADDDGFTPIPGRRGHGTRASFGGERGYRGRGRGRGGFRGEGGGYRGDREGGGGGYRGDREGGGGGYRGDREGGYRNREGGEGGEGGGEGGGYRGRGGYRGGYRGEGGEGGGEGGEGRGRGGYRGGYRGDGGEGGEGGRGGYRGGGEGGRGRGFGGSWRSDGERGGRGGYRGSGERRGSGFRGRGGPPGGAAPAAEPTAS